MVLDLVYLLFAVIQFAYLFGGASAPTMHGGYAEYARSGFFQLVEVAAINLTIVVVTLWARRDAPRSIVVQLAQVVLLGETLVVDASAAWRMGLYVSHYGLSELRAFTYLGMVAIAALALLAVVRVLRPVFPLYRSAMVTLFALWCAFALSGVDRWVVRYNVEGYASGSVHEIDLDYLVDISPDAADELENLSRGLVGSDSVLARRIDEVLARSGYSFAGEGLFGSFGSELGYRRVEWWQASVPIILRAGPADAWGLPGCEACSRWRPRSPLPHRPSTPDASHRPFISPFYPYRPLCHVFTDGNDSFVLKGGQAVLACTIGARMTWLARG